MKSLTRFLAALLLICWVTPAVRGADALDVTTFVVLGDGLTAGMRNSRLYAEAQEGSFPALAARQLQALFPLPLIKGPGLGSLPGRSAGPVDLPRTLQTTVRAFPPDLFIFNLSVPGFGPTETLRMRPAPPLIDKTNSTQTAANFILGFPSLILNRDVPYWTQLEYAQQLHATVILVSLGFDRVFSAAVRGTTAELSGSTSAFASRYGEILQGLSGLHAQVIVTTIPSPTLTPFFATLEQATRLVGVTPDVLAVLYGLDPGDRLTLPALFSIANQLLRRKVEPLPAGSVLPAAQVADLEAAVSEWNREITAAAQAAGAHVFDLAAYLDGVRQTGLLVAEQEITTDYLGGFYSLDAVYPGPLGQAAISNAFLTFLDQSFGTDTPLLSLSDFVDQGIARSSASARRGVYSIEQLEEFVPDLRRRLDLLRNRHNGRSPSRRVPAPRTRPAVNSTRADGPGGEQ